MFNFQPTDKFKMYLRKSRADIEAEARGEGDVLKRHERMLFDTAKRLNIIVREEDIYREIVSGETIADRVEMQKLLREVQTGAIRGVLVVEVERLSRGDNIDQGIVAQTFKYSNTLIITPTKIYDANDEYDEEFFEYGLFQSRREYKTTKRRLQNGRKSSIIEGKYVGNKPPYGYIRKKLEKQKGFTLDVHPEQAEAVKLIYEMYVHQSKGPTAIADELNRLGYKPEKLDNWSINTIRHLIRNPIYAGYVSWERRPQVKSMQNGSITKSRPRNYEYMKYKGLHPAIVDEQTWDRAQQIQASRSSPKFNPKSKTMKNPLSGLIICGICNKHLTRRPMPNQPDFLLCTTRNCSTIGAYLSFVEEDVLHAIETLIQKYKLDIKNPDRRESSELDQLKKSIARTNNEIATIDTQIDSLRDLLERNVYTIEVYMERLQKLNIKRDEVKKRLLDLNLNKESVQNRRTEALIPRMENIVEAYYSLDDPAERNTLLKGSIESIIYSKTKRGGKDPQSQRNYTLLINPYFFNND